VITRNRIRQIISEAAGVPDDMDMMVNIFTNMVKDEIKSFKDSGKPLKVGEADVKNYGDAEFRSGKINVGKEKSWQYVKNSPLFNKELWDKFPLYKNKITISFMIFPDEALDVNNIKKPTINAVHIFETEKMGIKDTKGLGKTYSSGEFEFDITMGDSNWDNLETLSPNLDSVIAHEVFHSFQLFKRYTKSNQVGFGKEHTLNTLAGAMKKDFNKEFNYFLHMLYLSLRFEHQARIPQTLRVLKSKKIENYNDFITAIKDTDAYGEAQMLKSFSADKLINDLSKTESFEDLLRKPMARQHTQFALESWNDILEKIIEHGRGNGMTTNPFRGMSQKLLKDPKLFFKHWEKVFDKRGDELLRSLSKLYSLL
jgi:hypothetical protein